MKKIFILIFFMPFRGITQSENRNKIQSDSTKSVNWTESVSWEEVLSKAKTENKYIFVDCYATWCKPCKMMDRMVYTNDSVREFINLKFIPVKVQMDTSKNDSYNVIRWYPDAKKLLDKYQVKAFPTLLFLSPKGEIIHKDLGFKDAPTFLSSASDALDPNKQYFFLAKNYRNGNKEYSTMRYLASTAYKFKDTAFANLVAQDYISNYLLKQPEDIILDKKNIEFLFKFTRNPKDKGFGFLYKNTNIVNKVVDNPDYVQALIMYIIAKDEIDPILFPKNKSLTKEPNWDSIKNVIKKKYNTYYSKRTISEAQLRSYGHQKKWKLWMKHAVVYVNKYGNNMSDYQLADYSWFFFENSLEKKELNAALVWTKRVINRSKDSLNVLPNMMDTYANLLYKIKYLSGEIGSIQNALDMEERAINIWTKFNVEIKVKEFRKTLELMKKGEVTWKH